MTHILIASHHVLILHTPLENKAGGRNLAAEKKVALDPGLVPRHGSPGSPTPFIQYLLVAGGKIQLSGCCAKQVGSGLSNRLICTFPKLSLLS